jgi:hypothetical protein
MTFSNRRRLIRLSWSFVNNGFAPFLAGLFFAFFLTSAAVVDVFTSFDKSGLGVCKVANEDGQ